MTDEYEDTGLYDNDDTEAEEAEIEATESDEPEEEEIALEDVEYDGKQYKIPPELKGALLRQQDYTQKTQHLAEMRKQAEAQLEAIKAASDADEASAEIKADLRTVDKSLKQYENVDWGRFAAENPAQAQAAMLQYQQLQMHRQQLADGLNTHEQTKRQASEQARYAALAQAKADLLQAMPDFNADVAREIVASTVSHYGYSPDEINAITDPRQVRILRDAMSWRKSQEAATKAAKAVTAPTQTQTVKPSSKKTVNPDKMSTAEWMAYERKRMSKRG